LLIGLVLGFGGVGLLVAALGFVGWLFFSGGDEDPAIAQNSPNVQNQSKPTGSSQQRSSNSNSTTATGLDSPASGTHPNALHSRPISTDGNIAASSNQPANYYAFLDGDHYIYDIQVRAKHDEITETSTGRVNYTIQSRNQKPQIRIRPEISSGTAFVITSDGLMLTCAHVIENASEIEIQVHGTTTKAAVVAADYDIDLAIIKVPLSNLAVLPITRNNSAQLGQDVRALGYPLSDVLGTNLKVTKGSISGVVIDDGQKQLQIDAAINSGNSGGPIINNFGEVIGVASAKLTGVEVSSVGLCIPAETVNQFLKKHGIVQNGPDLNKSLSGPELVSRSQPGIAFVKVTSGGSGDQTHSVVAFSSFVSKMQSGSRSLLKFRPSDSSLSLGSGNMKVTRRGKIVDVEEEPQLPFLLGGPSSLLMLELPADDRSKWTTVKPSALIQERNNGPTGFRFMAPHGRGRRREIVGITEAIETSKFTIQKRSVNSLTLLREYEFQTLGNASSSIKTSGTGTLIFDLKRGVPSSYDFKGSFETSLGNKVLQIPFTLTASLLSKADTESNLASESSKKLEKASKQLDNLKKHGLAGLDDPAGDAPVLKVNMIAEKGDVGFLTSAIAFSPDGKFIAINTFEKYEVFSVEKNRVVFSKKNDLTATSVHKIVFTPDGKQVVDIGSKEVIRFWDFAEDGTLTPNKVIHTQDRDNKFLKISPDGARLYYCGRSDTLRCIDLKTEEHTYILPNFKTEVCDMMFKDDGTALALGGRVVVHFDSETGSVKSVYELSSRGYGANSFLAPDGKRVYTGSLFGMTLQNFKAGAKINEYESQAGSSCAALTLDGKYLIYSQLKNLIVWSTTNHKVVGQIPLDSGGIGFSKIVLSPDGKRMACCPKAPGTPMYIFDLPTEIVDSSTE